MTKPLILKFNAYGRAYILLIDNDAALILITLYPPLKTRFTHGFDALYQALIRQYQRTGSITIDKSVIMGIMIATVRKFQLRAKIQSANLGRNDLRVAFDKPISFLSQGSQEDVLANCTTMYNLIDTNSATLTVILPADLTEMSDIIDKYKSILAMPIKAIKDRKAETTDIYPALFAEMDDVCDLIGGVLESYKPELFIKWKNELKIGKPSGRRHESIVCKFVDQATGVPIYKMVVTLTDGINTYELITTRHGYIRKYSLPPANYSFTTEHPVYPPYQQDNIAITDDNTANFIIKLKKQ